MKHEEGTFPSADGLNLYYQSWLPAGDPKAVIVIVHGMGGNVTINYVLRNPDGYNAVVASAPAVGKLDVPPILAIISRVLSRLAPSLQVKTNLELKDISRDPVEAKAYGDDPLIQTFATPRFGVEFPLAAEWAMTQAAEFTPPLLIIHGDGDNIVNVSASRDFFARVTQPDKKLIVYEGGVHESHNDLHRDQVIADIKQWLESHL